MGKLTTHVLDTAQGLPGGSIALKLFRVDAERTLVRSAITNADGRTDEPLLDAHEFALGKYELVFDVGEYFSASAIPTSDPPFLDDVALRFTLSEDKHYHVPLLVSPWSYSTYRGS